MPQETRFVRDQEVTKEGALVIPLDEIRSLNNVTYTVASGISGVVFTIASGKEAYITQALFSELSGNASIIQLHDTRGSGLCVPIPVAGNSVVSWDPRPTACGPITSGITVQRPRMGGAITLLVQVDPKRIE